jgi:hypothetical protein
MTMGRMKPRSGPLATSTIVQAHPERTARDPWHRRRREVVPVDPARWLFESDRRFELLWLGNGAEVRSRKEATEVRREILLSNRRTQPSPVHRA